MFSSCGSRALSRVDPMSSHKTNANLFRKQTSCPALCHCDGVRLESGREITVRKLNRTPPTSGGSEISTWKHRKTDEPGDRLHNALDGAQAGLGRKTDTHSYKRLY